METSNKKAEYNQPESFVITIEIADNILSGEGDMHNGGFLDE